MPGTVTGALRTASVVGLVVGGALGTLLSPRTLVVLAGLGGLGRLGVAVVGAVAARGPRRGCRSGA